MVEEGSTKLCSICDGQIPEAKFRLHEAQCARNNYKCPDCGEVVAKADRESHQAEAHVKVRSIEFSDVSLGCL
jgi:hypothetical protein